MHKNIFQNTLKKIVPTKEERTKVITQVNEFLNKLNQQLDKTKTHAKATIGGSYSKDTWLSGDYDVDIFVRFDINYKDQNISDTLEKALKLWNHERIHGSRDYYWIRNGIKYEIVPVLNITKPEQAQNVTDFSPLHVNWVNKKGKTLKNDIRLAKKFCKASKCYGAESYIRGFSGHVLDILVIYYKGFLPLLKAATKWKPKTILDYNNEYRGQALIKMNKSKTEGPLILVDPVQPGRNAAAALTQENYDKFIQAAKKYLKKPTENAFIEKEQDLTKLKGNLIKIKVKTLDDKEDVAGTKFVRAYEHIKDKLTDFEVKNTGWQWDKKENGTWWFILAKQKLNEEYEHQGPPLKFKEAVENFKRKYEKTYLKKGKIYAKIKRTHTTPTQILNEILKEEYIKTRIKQATQC